MTAAALTGISPVVLVGDLARAVDYWTRCLGFTCAAHGDPPDFATADRDGQTMLLAHADSPRIVPHWQIVERMWDAYVRVDDVDAIYAEVWQRGAAIDYELDDALHGFREFGVHDPDGHDIAFGQRVVPFAR